MGSIIDTPKKALQTVLDPFNSLQQSAGQAAEDLLAPKIPNLPSPIDSTKVPVMPLPDDQAVKAAKRRSLAMQLQRGGRASTILSQPQSDTLG